MPSVPRTKKRSSMLQDEKLIALKTDVEELLIRMDHAIKVSTLDPNNIGSKTTVHGLKNELALLLAKVGVVRNPNPDPHS